jgi:hypothetical protein
MGFADLVLFYVVTGISLRWIATAATLGPSAIVIWIGAWLCFYVPLALSVLELSSRYPQEGGPTPYRRTDEPAPITVFRCRAARLSGVCPATTSAAAT